MQLYLRREAGGGGALSLVEVFSFSYTLLMS